MSKTKIASKLLMLVSLPKEKPQEPNVQWILRVKQQPNGMYNLLDILNKS